MNKATPELLDIHNEPHSLFQTITEKLGLFLVLGIALFLAPGSIMALWGGGIESIEDMTVVACVLLTFISIIYYLVQTFLLDGHCHSESHTDLKSVLLESVIDITMVITYVFVGLVVANFVIEVIVGPDQFKEWMSSSALLSCGNCSINRCYTRMWWNDYSSSSIYLNSGLPHCSTYFSRNCN